jgi:hypothetical protein
VLAMQLMVTLTATGIITAQPAPKVNKVLGGRSI